jgi:prolyl oligopeptidase
MPPPTPRVDHVDDLHGTAVADPYRWLEDPADPRVRAWVEEQNAAARAWLDRGDGLRERVRDRLAARWDRPRRGVPWREGDRWFQLRNSGLQDQDVLWTMAGPGEEGRILLDPAALDADGPVALAAVAASRDGRLVAWAASEAGSDWQTWRVRRVEDGTDLPEVLRWGKFSTAAWTADGAGFFYGRYPAPAPGRDLVDPNQGQQLWYHRAGTSQDDDVLVVARPDRPDWGFDPVVTRDGRWLVVHVWEGTDRRNRLWVADLRAGDPGALDLVPLRDDLDAAYALAGADGDVLYVRTDRDAPRGRIVAIDTADPRPDRWREVVPEGPATLEAAQLAGGRLVTRWLDDASSRVRRHGLDGTDLGEVALPGLGTVDALSGRPDDPVVHLSFTGFTVPPAVFRHDLDRGTTAPAWSAPGGPDPAAFTTSRRAATSPDGTRVPYWLVRAAGAAPDPNAPTLLYGYGGFGIPITPAYRVAWAVWLELGGQLAVANLRGGGEFGEAWYEAGRGPANRERVIDDALAVAAALVDDGATSPDRLGLNGASNGGLLVGACLTRAPERFGACVPEVGVLDLLRFQRFTIGWAWVPEYGSPDDPDAFPALLAASPLHRIRPGTAYPPTLVVTGDHDDRVVPAHSYKFAAALQAAQAGDAPVLLRVETATGHGAGKPTSAAIEERADVLTFLARALHLEVP